MPRLRAIVVSAAFAAAAAIVYGSVNRTYVENYRLNEAESRAAKTEIKAMVPHITALRARFEVANDDSRYLWRDANRALEDAHRVLTLPLRADAKRDCDILFRMNELNLITGQEYPLSPQTLSTLNMCRKHIVRFRGH